MPRKLGEYPVQTHLRCLKCGHEISLWEYNQLKYPDGCPMCGSKELRSIHIPPITRAP